MKKVSHICLVLFTMVFFTTCKKKITEPEHKLKGRQLIYIEVDGKKFEIIDKKFQWYKNTKGQFRKYDDAKDKIIKFEIRKNVDMTIGFDCSQSLKESYLNINFTAIVAIDSLDIHRDIIDFSMLYNKDRYYDVTYNANNSKNIKEQYISDENCNYRCGTNCKIRILGIDENKKRVQAQIWLKLIKYVEPPSLADYKDIYIYMDSNY